MQPRCAAFDQLMQSDIEHHVQVDLTNNLEDLTKSVRESRSREAACDISLNALNHKISLYVRILSYSHGADTLSHLIVAPVSSLKIQKWEANFHSIF